jgi:hypothetical protein
MTKFDLSGKNCEALSKCMSISKDKMAYTFNEGCLIRKDGLNVQNNPNT